MFAAVVLAGMVVARQLLEDEGCCGDNGSSSPGGEVCNLCQGENVPLCSSITKKGKGPDGNTAYACERPGGVIRCCFEQQRLWPFGPSVTEPAACPNENNMADSKEYVEYKASDYGGKNLCGVAYSDLVEDSNRAKLAARIDGNQITFIRYRKDSGKGGTFEGVKACGLQSSKSSETRGRCDGVKGLGTYDGIWVKRDKVSPVANDSGGSCCFGPQESCSFESIFELRDGKYEKKNGPLGKVNNAIRNEGCGYDGIYKPGDDCGDVFEPEQYIRNKCLDSWIPDKQYCYPEAWEQRCEDYAPVDGK